ncbi:dbp7p [Saccharomyces arboricola H-6]|uniref:ATP-dependent RNA helicase n=1 Tax=Saccharomyces arboricola (strain H-6 / AS 2.3317 / CBS 10644) TaxID=1160507 RepID=J8PZX2_SACAR|nr:dbp7p [Saccharomyces arboricola H-6]
MSDDDSMLLNFSTNYDAPGDSFKQATKVTGGRWKDRRRMKMKLDGKLGSRKRRADAGGDQTMKSEKEDRSSKKTHRDNANGSAVQERPNAIKGQNTQGRMLPADSQFVSSLFTSNREITTAVNTNIHDESVAINPSNAPLKSDLFASLGVSDVLVSHLEQKMRIQKPTSIQKQAIPQIMANAGKNDFFIHAQTGSGKTLSYLLPIISTVLNMETHVDRSSGAFALIVAPTRELASQIYQVCSTLISCCHYLVPCLLIGGERKKSEKARLRKGCNFIIGTPGRILDHLQNTKVIKEQLSQSLRYIVLDEGDKLMELGFDETISNIINIVHDIPINSEKFPKLPHKLVHMLCSATLTDGVNKLRNVALKDYKLISNGTKKDSDAVTVAPDQLLQRITIVPPKLRLVTLAATLNNITKDFVASDPQSKTLRTIVFVSCSDSVEFHYDAFSGSDGHHKNLTGDSVRLLTKGNTMFPCFSGSEDPNMVIYKLHGSLSQQARTSTLQHFARDNETTKGKHLIMFCTDVASRGLDLPQVGSVIELDPPFAVEDHLHRVGRTARAGEKGESLLFLLPGEEEKYMDYIQPYHPMGWELLQFDKEILMPAFKDVNVNRNDKFIRKDDKPSKNKDGDDKEYEWDTNATTWHLNIERRVVGDSTLKNLAVKGFISHVRAYATHISQEKKFFNVKFLHLGHLAKSFGLRERPKAMGLQSSKDGNSEKPAKENSKNKMFRMARMAEKQIASEFNY